MPRESDHAICAICAGRGTGVGFHVPSRATFRPLWLCDDIECLAIARKTYAMSQQEFDRIEMMATMEAGQGLERFCDAIGKTDFREFSQSEYETAMRRVIEDYRAALQGKLRDESPF